MAESVARQGAAIEPDERLEQRAARSLSDFGAGLERIERIARSVANGQYGQQELRHLQRQVDRSVQELDGLAESARYLTVHLWDPPPGARSNDSSSVEDRRRVQVRMLWPVPSARHRLMVAETGQATQVLHRVDSAQQVLRSTPRGPGAGTWSPDGASSWRLDEESPGVRAMVAAAWTQLEALERLLQRTEAAVSPA